MFINFLVALITLIFFQWSVNGSVQLLHSHIVVMGYEYSRTTQTLTLFGVGQFIASLIFNNILRRFGFFRLFISSTIFLVAIFLLLDTYMSLNLLQLLIPFISMGQSIGYLCLLDLFAPVFSNYLPGSFSIISQIGRSVGLVLPFFAFAKLNNVLCFITLVSLLLFTTANINFFKKDTEMFADVSEVYKNYSSLFWSCCFMKIGDTLLSGFFRVALKMIKFSNLQCQYLSLSLLLGSVFGIILYSNDPIASNVAIIINVIIILVCAFLQYFYARGTDNEIMFILIGLFAYGGLVVLTRYFHRNLLIKFIANKNKMFSIIQTQTHIEYMASFAGYVLGVIVIKTGIYGVIYTTLIAHILSWLSIIM